MSSLVVRPDNPAADRDGISVKNESTCEFHNSFVIDEVANRQSSAPKGNETRTTLTNN